MTAERILEQLGAHQPGRPRKGRAERITSAAASVFERLTGKPGALHHAIVLLRLGAVCDRRIHVVVESEEVDASFGQPPRDLAFGIEIVGFVPQVNAGIVFDPDDPDRGRRHRLDLEQAALCHHRTARDRLEHDPEKWSPVFGKDHAQTRE